jgi:hypothetical protein
MFYFPKSSFNLLLKNNKIITNNNFFFFNYLKKKIDISYLKFFNLNNKIIPIFEDFSYFNFSPFWQKQFNTTIGFSYGFCTKLRLSGLGFKFSQFKNLLFVRAGLIPSPIIKIPVGVRIYFKKKSEIELYSTNFLLLSKISSEILNLTSVNPYTLKGILHYKQNLKKKISSKLATL